MLKFILPLRRKQPLDFQVRKERDLKNKKLLTIPAVQKYTIIFSRAARFMSHLLFMGNLLCANNTSTLPKSFSLRTLFLVVSSLG